MFFLLFVTPWTVPTRLLCPWDSPGKRSQGIFPTQGSNPSLPHCRQILYCLGYYWFIHYAIISLYRGFKISRFFVWIRLVAVVIVQWLSCFWLFAAPWTATRQASLSFPEFAQTHVHWVSDAIQPSHPLSPPSPRGLNLSQQQGLFQWVSCSYQVTKILELQLQHQSFQ